MPNQEMSQEPAGPVAECEMRVQKLTRKSWKCWAEFPSEILFQVPVGNNQNKVDRAAVGDSLNMGYSLGRLFEYGIYPF